MYSHPKKEVKKMTSIQKLASFLQELAFSALEVLLFAALLLIFLAVGLTV